MSAAWPAEKHLVYPETKYCMKSTAGLGPSTDEHQHLDNVERKRSLQRLRRKDLRGRRKTKVLFISNLVKKWFSVKPKKTCKVKSNVQLLIKLHPKSI